MAGPISAASKAKPEAGLTDLRQRLTQAGDRIFIGLGFDFDRNYGLLYSP